MSDISDFKVGQRVAHVHMGNGVVTEDGGILRVKYDEWAGVCAYNAQWFRDHPRYLFHRTDPEGRVLVDVSVKSTHHPEGK